MRLKNLEYAKIVKTLAQLDEIAGEAAGTFAERRIRELRGRIVVAAASKWGGAIQKTRPNKPSVFVVEDDVAFAKRKWLNDAREKRD